MTGLSYQPLGVLYNLGVRSDDMKKTKISYEIRGQLYEIYSLPVNNKSK